MRKLFSIVAVLGLSACMGGGSDGGSNGVEVSLNEGFGALMNETRTATTDLKLDTRLVNAAQIHADDMFARNYDTVEVMGETIVDPADGVTVRAKDIGDIVRDEARYDWSAIKELLARGQFTNEQALAVWNSDTCSGGQRCYDDPTYEDFGIAKAGSGSDQRWVLILATER